MVCVARNFRVKNVPESKQGPETCNRKEELLAFLSAVCFSCTAVCFAVGVTPTIVEAITQQISQVRTLPRIAC